MNALRLSDYLNHMLAAAKEVEGFVEGLTGADFLADRRTQQAVVMNLLIIGEAAAKVVDSAPGFALAHPEVPWRSIRGMRNRMAHGYFVTNYELVWETVSTDIPRLIVDLSNLLAQRLPHEHERDT